MVKNSAVVFKKIPVELPVIGEHLVLETREFDLDQIPLEEGDFAVKTLRLSLDPYMRGRMRSAELKSYISAFQLGAPIQSFGVSVVIKSKNPSFPEGEIVYGITSFEEYSVIKAASIKLQGLEGLHLLKDAKSSGFPLSYFIGILGMPGMTAYTGLFHIGNPKAGETIYISAASGAVGQLVGQIAKSKGLRVVGSAGDDAKVEYLIKDLGFDAAFNYKKINHDEALSKYCPDGVDIYFENVGGEILDNTISHMNDFGRIIACGMISQYNTQNLYGVKNLRQIVSKRLRFEGFIVSDLAPQYADDFYRDVAQWLREGRIRYREHEIKGIENASQGLLDLFHGKNFGKAYVHIADL
ncbi:uncharacterized protein VTP21DRAFT_8152 [Calcarisporiella thermophila]|uniref:uncharacterized protein n=1 Tax=Calcarisporiella thermophila TaxID=911321 RepID=UPI00374228D6